MRIFITGGCGFIGSHLAEYHLAKGDEVHIIDNLSTGRLENIAAIQDHPHFRFDQADLLTWNNLDEAIKWADRIYHFAAVVGIFKVINEPIHIVSNNIIGCQHLLDAVSKSSSRPIVLIASSSSVYGNSSKHLLNEKDDLIIKAHNYPLSTYVISKLSDETIGLAYYRDAHIPIILPRLFNVIGPNQTGMYGMVVPRFVKQACKNESLTIYGEGTQTRSFCDVRDVVVMLDLLAQNPKAIGEIINVGNDHEISINDLAIQVCQLAKKPLKKQYIPYKEAYGVDFTDITQRRPDLSKFFKLTNFTHQWTLEQTIMDLISRGKK